MLKISQYTKSFDNNSIVLSNISFETMPNKITGIWGSNGSGKSTLLKAILGLLDDFPHENITFQENISIGYVPQSPEEYLLPWKTCKANLELHYQMKNEFLNKHLCKFGFDTDMSDKYPYQLSGGYLQRLSWACTLLPTRNLVLLDEPFSKQDSKHSELLIKTLREFITEAKDRSALLISHEPNYLIQCCDHIIVLKSNYSGGSTIHEMFDVLIDSNDRLNMLLQHNDYLYRLFSIYQ